VRLIPAVCCLSPRARGPYTAGRSSALLESDRTEETVADAVGSRQGWCSGCRRAAVFSAALLEKARPPGSLLDLHCREAVANRHHDGGCLVLHNHASNLLVVLSHLFRFKYFLAPLFHPYYTYLQIVTRTFTNHEHWPD
jgi:hypothetical protein